MNNSESGILVPLFGETGEGQRHGHEFNAKVRVKAEPFLAILDQRAPCGAPDGNDWAAWLDIESGCSYIDLCDCEASIFFDASGHIENGIEEAVSTGAFFESLVFIDNDRKDRRISIEITRELLYSEEQLSAEAESAAVDWFDDHRGDDCFHGHTDLYTY